MLKRGSAASCFLQNVLAGIVRSEFVKRYHPMSLDGLFRWLRSKILRSPVEIVGYCQMCGNCCRSILISDKGNWLKTRDDFERLVADTPEYERFRIIGECSDGLLFSCDWLGEDNCCKDHENRLPICREYPAPTLFYYGGGIMRGCGFHFRALTFRQAFRRLLHGGPEDFEVVLMREKERLHSTESAEKPSVFSKRG